MKTLFCHKHIVALHDLKLIEWKHKTIIQKNKKIAELGITIHLWNQYAPLSKLAPKDVGFSDGHLKI